MRFEFLRDLFRGGGVFDERRRHQGAITLSLRLRRTIHSGQGIDESATPENASARRFIVAGVDATRADGCGLAVPITS